jgi:DHA2 family multidrug resistance protein
MVKMIKPENMEQGLSGWQRVLLFVCISLVTFLIVLDYSIANVSIPYISGGLSVSNEQGTYVITMFAVGSAIGLAMTGFLTKRIGEVKLVVGSTLLFTFFSWICGLSYSLEMIVVARFIQGIVSGPLIPLSQSLIVKYGTEESRTRDLSFWSTIVITGPVIGPLLGGYISDWYHWPWIFYINIPVGLFAAGVLWIMLRDKESATEKIPIDYGGVLLLIIGVTCLQIFLDKGQDWDWWRSEKIWLLMIGSVLGFVYLFIREWWHPKPLLELHLFKIPSFTISIICLIFSYAIYFGSVVIVPLWLQEFMDYNAEWAGISVCTLGIAPICLSMLSPIIIKKLGNLGALTIGFFFFGAGCFYSAFFTTQVDVIHVALGRFIFGIGFICYVTPMFSISIQDIPQDKLPSATGIFHFFRAMVGGIGTSIFVTMWERRTIFHHLRLGEVLTPFNPMTPNGTDPVSLTRLNRMTDVQAAMLGINDTFYIMGWLFVALIILLFGMRYFLSTRPTLKKES